MKTKLATFFTPGSQTGPVTEVALGRVVPLQHVAVPALLKQILIDLKRFVLGTFLFIFFKSE